MPGALLALPRAFPSRYGAPVLRSVDPEIFRRQYFTHCLECTFCNDWCCQFGVDVDRYHVDRILAHAAELEAYLGIPRERWFTAEREPDAESPGGETWRTSVMDGACVFLNRSGRGCRLHAFCLERGLDHHELKSVVDGLFPLTFEGGVLCPALEAEENELVCLGTGPTLYRGIREEIRYYFGDELITVLDALETKTG
ncbi:MAG TPA: hypothetical protein VLB49_00025 [Gemmatimonadales bacterium]|nr:hypothetical protein [Gemmatimonadales bacterium]